MKLITIKTFNNPLDAHLLKTRLEDDGIDCIINDENIGILNPLLNIVTGGIKLKINEKDIDNAIQIINEIEKTPVYYGETMIKCPKCYSTDFYIGFHSRKAWWALWSIIATILLFFPISFNHVYRCKVCACEWE